MNHRTVMGLNFQPAPAQVSPRCTPGLELYSFADVPALLAHRAGQLKGARRKRTLVLLVEPNAATSVILQRGLAPVADVVASSSFLRARHILRERPPDLLVTNLRLAEYNGLHLVYVATARTRSVVYSTAGLDRVLAVEAQRQAAFYESCARLVTALPAYVNALLPTRDRRDVSACDRRSLSRGGRRAPDASTELGPH